MIVGRTYLERGQPVLVLAQWQNREPADPCPFIVPPRRLTGLPATTPRNVLIQRPCGLQVVRPFRGLRVAKASGPTY